MNTNIKTERQNMTLSKRLKLLKNAHQQKKTDNKSSVAERNIELAKRATPKDTIFPSTNQSLKMDLDADSVDSFSM